MPRVQTNVVTLRVNETVADALRMFAERNGMRNKSGDPNISEAARAIIMLALSQGVPEVQYASALENARAEWLERVNGAWRAAMAQLTQIGLRGS